VNKQFYFLSGLPRTGSTLLSSILSQNPNIHAEGSSHVCELMWQSFNCSLNENKNNWNDDIVAADRQETIQGILSSIPNLYYSNVNKPIVLEKNRNWTLPTNFNLIKDFITNKPKIVVLVRPIEEIVASFVLLRKKNNWQEENIFDGMLNENDNPIMRPLEGALWAKENNNGEFLFVQYDELVFETTKTLKKIYDFCEWQNFDHNLENINRPFIQRDEAYKLIGLHDVRKIIEKQNYQIYFPKNILKKCHYLNSLLFED
jgi:sulfotransferase